MQCRVPVSVSVQRSNFTVHGSRRKPFPAPAHATAPILLLPSLPNKLKSKNPTKPNLTKYCSIPNQNMNQPVRHRAHSSTTSLLNCASSAPLGHVRPCASVPYLALPSLTLHAFRNRFHFHFHCDSILRRRHTHPHTHTHARTSSLIPDYQFPFPFPKKKKKKKIPTRN